MFNQKIPFSVIPPPPPPHYSTLLQCCFSQVLINLSVYRDGGDIKLFITLVPKIVFVGLTTLGTFIEL